MCIRDRYSTQFGGQTLDCISIHQADFGPKEPQEVTKIARPPARTTYDGIPLVGSTTYKQSFLDFGGKTYRIQPGKPQKTVIPELKFQGRTTYGDHFPRPAATERARPSTARDSGSPFMALPFFGESAYSTSFKPFKVARVGKPNERAPSQERLKPWPGQYATETQKVFAGQQVPPCPAREVLESLAETSVRAAAVLGDIKN
eukprot:TRINITY_DN6535_c0_g2_i1.p1 TRINITY_DN6535_c0_g2~~TRINITY_DN6535_c0_g2_i1.p1  ORF type:complete len:202 (+),score=35.60 TRINITY_DN6535_c0_g2_i1:64-669(+)